jgi:glycosyltransferase involved in cell wall biosynthesis
LKASIIALCYNHEAYLEEALTSISDLPEEWVEIIVVDDASTDKSVEIIKKWQTRKPDWKFIFNEKNKGNCQSFNSALAISKGKWILDFATDDILIPEAFLSWLEFAEQNLQLGFCYADAYVFSEKNKSKSLFSNTVKLNSFPEGDIFPKLFGPGFICPPAVLFQAEKLKAEGGYQNNLAYEDWDIWLRLSRKYSVLRFPDPVIYYRKHPASLSASVFQKRNEKLLESTLSIVENTLQWPEFENVDIDDYCLFMRYHIRLCFFLQLPNQAKKFFQLFQVKANPGLFYKMMVFLSDKMSFIYPLYRWLKS